MTFFAVLFVNWLTFTIVHNIFVLLLVLPRCIKITRFIKLSTNFNFNFVKITPKLQKKNIFFKKGLHFPQTYIIIVLKWGKV